MEVSFTRPDNADPSDLLTTTRISSAGAKPLTSQEDVHTLVNVELEVAIFEDGAVIAKVPRDTVKVTVAASVFSRNVAVDVAVGLTSQPFAPEPVEVKFRVEPEIEQPVVP